MYVEIYVEPSGLMQTISSEGSVASQLLSDELLANLIQGADRDLRLNEALVRHMRNIEPELLTVNEMNEAQWKGFLDSHFGNSQWARWHAKNGCNRYNIIVSPHPPHASTSAHSPSQASSRATDPEETVGMIIALVLLAAMAVGIWWKPFGDSGLGRKVILSVLSIPVALLVGMFWVKALKFIGGVTVLILSIYLVNHC
jgi:hypothetical protein